MSEKIPLVVQTNFSIVDNIYDIFERFREYVISNDEIGEDLEEEEVIFVGGNGDCLIFKAQPHNENLFIHGLEYDYKICLPVESFGNYTIRKKQLTASEVQDGQKYENLLAKINIKYKYRINNNIRPTLNYYRIFGKENMPPNYNTEFFGEICTITTFGETINVKVLTLDGIIVDHTYQYKDLDKLTNIQLLRVED
jgi:hypothetical protein